MLLCQVQSSHARGVFLSISEIILSILCLPHARGCFRDDLVILPAAAVFPTHVGCFTQLFDAKAQEVFPTHVGVFLLGSFLLMFARRLPHARGGVSWLTYAVMLLVGSSPRTWGVSDDNFAYFAALASSPRTWGCFFLFFLTISAALVFPTHVGVFLRVDDNNAWRAGLPHARGGVSLLRMTRGNGLSSSPRTWGCFSMASCW
ncbi:hypothetical protein EAO30_05110 [Klebsiella pneumoniae]|nr:hypothetical protein EAO30_05110 [Klebsiella pneumoniae]